MNTTYKIWVSKSQALDRKREEKTMNGRPLGCFLAVFLGLSIFVYAQDSQSMVNDRIAKMTRELNLTDAQAMAIKPVIKEYIAQRDAVLQETQGQVIIDRAALKNTMRTLKEFESQSLRKILSEDQMKRWTQKENLRAAFNKGGTESQVKDDVSLTPEGANFKF
jgi:hypothetical protein